MKYFDRNGVYHRIFKEDFSEKDVALAIQKIVSVLEKKLNSKFVKVGKQKQFLKRKNRELYGIKYEVVHQFKEDFGSLSRSEFINQNIDKMAETIVRDVGYEEFIKDPGGVCRLKYFYK